MTLRMLIDARHREETRVAVVKGNRIEEFDFESAEHKQLKGNIYLAKVTRVEPSLQAAFVDFGGNRHGFLAFSEIHPDYYQIPKEDRDALLREEAEHAAEEEALRAAQADEEDEINETQASEAEDRDPDNFDDDDQDRPGRRERVQLDSSAVEALRSKRMALRRRYKIQDVIRRRQVLLVQVVKEERGNKGAALTTYLSLAGRYCVLMPNSAHGGGISRKISNVGDRKRLKSIMAELTLPPTMGCIVRTAGLSRTKIEIKRDFDYLARLWDEIREHTLASSAPALIYGDSDLIKRAIRDIYNREIEEVIIEGEEGYRAAKDFMKLLMPSHARRVKLYVDAVPLFQRYSVEDQLAAMYQPTVQLKSGGYLVINPTEALVSIDINSGRSTREHGIEATAVSTNLEAAHEIARQLRLRDMAGLVVIDFIDMENNANVRKVEKAMKAALANDRARIQVGRISSFGLMEMSRQRLRTGVLEASTRQCPHCEGTGLVRTASSAGLSALRMLEDEAARGRGSRLILRASQEAAVYVLNRKRAELAEIEARYGVAIEILPDGEAEGARMSVEASGPAPEHLPRFAPVLVEEDEDALAFEDQEDALPASAGVPDEIDSAERIERARRRRRRARRNQRDAHGDQLSAARSDDSDVQFGSHEFGSHEDEDGLDFAEREDDQAASRDGAKRRRNRRGRRGGRRHQDVGNIEPSQGFEFAEPSADLGQDMAQAQKTDQADHADGDTAVPKRPARRAQAIAQPTEIPQDAESAYDRVAQGDHAPKTGPKTKRPRAKAAVAAEQVPVQALAARPLDEIGLDEAGLGEASLREAGDKPKRPRKQAAPKVKSAPLVRAAMGLEASPLARAEPVATPIQAPDAPSAPPRRGWWQRTFGAKE